MCVEIAIFGTILNFFTTRKGNLLEHAFKEVVKRILCILLFILLFTTNDGYAKKPSIESLINRNSSILVMDQNDRIIYDKNSNKKRIPASTIKLLTSLAAFHYLGEDYHYKTEVYRSSNGDFILKGYGDPVFVSEEMERMAASIREKKYILFNKLILDATYFSYPIKIPGVSKSFNPYDALNGALCVNFNTVYYQRDTKWRPISAEPHTPLLPFVISKIKPRTPKGRISIFRNHKDTVLYVGHLMKYFLNNEGIQISDNIVTGSISSKDQLIYTHESKTSLSEIISMLLEYSNNFIANQLLISVGAHVYDSPGTIKKGLKAFRTFSKNQLGLTQFKQVEGSGISRKNKISAKDMCKVLKAFEPYKHLLVKKDYQRYKSGTLNGVRTRAGYLEISEKISYRFVIMLYKKNITTDVVDRIMDRVVSDLLQKHNTPN